MFGFHILAVFNFSTITFVSRIIYLINYIEHIIFIILQINNSRNGHLFKTFFIYLAKCFSSAKAALILGDKIKLRKKEKNR